MFKNYLNSEKISSVAQLSTRKSIVNHAQFSTAANNMICNINYNTSV